AASGERLEYFDQGSGERYIPHVIEPAAGATRTMMAFLLAAYEEDEIGGESRTVLRLHHRLAPYQVAVLPLSKKDTLSPLAREVADRFLQAWTPHDAEMPWGVDPAGIEEVIKELKAEIPPATRIAHLEADFEHPLSPRAVIESAVDELGAVDILVCNHARS